MQEDTQKNKDKAKDRENIVRIRLTLDKAIKEEIASWKKNNPRLAAQYGIKTQSVYYKKRPPGFGKVIPAIMGELLQKGSADKTQKEILDIIRPQFSKHNIHANIWSKKLQSWELEKVEDKIRMNMKAPINIKGCKTLSAIKERLRAITNTVDTDYTAKAIVHVKADTLMVGRKAYNIVDRKSGDFTYPSVRVTVAGKRYWMRIDALFCLLEGK